MADLRGVASVVDRRRKGRVTVDVGNSVSDGVIVVVAVGEIIVVAHTDRGRMWCMRV